MQSQTNNELILLTSIVCIQSLIYLIPLCCRPLSTRHTIALSDMFLRPKDYSPGMVVCLEMAPKTNDIDHIFNL